MVGKTVLYKLSCHNCQGKKKCRAKILTFFFEGFKFRLLASKCRSSQPQQTAETLSKPSQASFLAYKSLKSDDHFNSRPPTKKPHLAQTRILCMSCRLGGGRTMEMVPSKGLGQNEEQQTSLSQSLVFCWLQCDAFQADQGKDQSNSGRDFRSQVH